MTTSYGNTRTAIILAMRVENLTEVYRLTFGAGYPEHRVCVRDKSGKPAAAMATAWGEDLERMARPRCAGAFCARAIGGTPKKATSCKFQAASNKSVSPTHPRPLSLKLVA